MPRGRAAKPQSLVRSWMRRKNSGPCKVGRRVSLVITTLHPCPASPASTPPWLGSHYSTCHLVGISSLPRLAVAERDSAPSPFHSVCIASLIFFVIFFYFFTSTTLLFYPLPVFWPLGWTQSLIWVCWWAVLCWALLGRVLVWSCHL